MSSNNTNPRKTFAIISHPDAGKTTLTEKLLLFGGAIQQAGAVKARGENRRARSDWMKVEQERGISVASSVMTFDYKDITFNLLDTPGHEDFSEDTYRVLTAVDSAVMVIDSAKGIETQTKKLFEVCRLRNVPIITFINKLDREGMDPFSLLDDIEKRWRLTLRRQLADRHGQGLSRLLRPDRRPTDFDEQKRRQITEKRYHRNLSRARRRKTRPSAAGACGSQAARRHRNGARTVSGL